MSKDRRATAVMFGFDFQVNAAIVLMLENIEYLKSLRLEGNFEDIELELENNEYVLAQAKAIEKSSTDFQNVRRNLKKAMVSLSEGAKKSNAKQLILITNSPNPLNEDESKNLFLGVAHREFNSLPESSKKLILDYLKEIEEPLDTQKFMIQILPFETDNDAERYKIVRQVVDDFIGDLNLNIPGIGKKLLRIWHDGVFKNGTKANTDIKLHKKDIIWPVLVIVTDIERCDDALANCFDTSLYEEIVHQYKEVIDSSCERCEFFIKVLCDYNEFESAKKPSEKCVDFALSKWEDYISELTLENADEETQRGLIQIILYNIVRNRLMIDRIKKGVKL